MFVQFILNGLVGQLLLLSGRKRQTLTADSDFGERFVRVDGELPFEDLSASALKGSGSILASMDAVPQRTHFIEDSPVRQARSFEGSKSGCSNPGSLSLRSAAASNVARELERAERLENKSARLTSAIELLEVGAEVELKSVPAAVPHFEATGRKVFLVHGRDTGPRESCARFLSQLGLEVVILHEQPDQGQTVIEKFEKHASVRFAVVLLTADDRGGERNIQFDGQKPRARQNVIFELGFFLGSLGRSRVCALYEEGVELPSDYHGVIYVPIDNGEAWKFRLAKELKAAGLEVDMNNAV